MTTSAGAGRSLAFRLAVAFVTVAVVGVASSAVVALLAARNEVSTLVQRQRDATAAAVVGSLARAYAESGSWQAADLRPTQTLVVTAPATLEIRTPDGRVVSTPRLEMANMMARMHHGPIVDTGPVRAEPVVIGDEQVGTALLRFPTAGGSDPTVQLRAGLTRGVVIGAILAALVAAVVAIGVARRIARPVSHLTAAVESFRRGDPDARADVSTDIGELATLAGSFNRMAAAIGERARQREQTAADIAHELRTPIAVLQASVESLVDGHEPPTRERLSSLHDEIIRLGRSVEDLERLSAAEGSQLSFARAPVDLGEVAGAAADAIRPQLDAAGIALDTSLQSAVVDGDAHRLRQVVTNLLTNAAKFTPAGGRVGVSVVRQRDVVELRVRDTGSGVEADEVPHLFERFWRGRNARGTGGSGIGLAITAELVHAHDGEVEVVSRPGEGSSFVVRLPAAPVTPPR